MPSRPLPPPPPSVRCRACKGRYGLDFEGKTPVAYHSLPYCAAFEAIETTVDAIEHWEKCQNKTERSA